MGEMAASGPDSLAAEVVEPLLTGRIGRPYTFQESCESTQALLGPDDPEGAAAVCDEQTAGRGRLGRPWVTPPGSAILVSVVLQPPRKRHTPQISLVRRCRRSLSRREQCPRALGADQVAERRLWSTGLKVAGVLAEARGRAIVLGIVT
jgi:BirA family biotin operon repressor/biotin-[acetyl-CoA-carboxylase] ligase